jgi:ankyrin repeat protein
MKEHLPLSREVKRINLRRFGVAAAISIIVVLLIASKFLNPWADQLCDAAADGNIPAMQKLISHGVDPNSMNLLYEDCHCDDDPGAAPPLEWAIFANHSKTEQLVAAKFLLDHGADPNGRGDTGMTPLMWVDSVAGAKLLIDHGADVNARDEYGRSVLDCAVDDGMHDPKVPDYLKSLGARRHIVDEDF